MALPSNSERIKFASTLKKELYEQLQQMNRETDVPLSKLFDRAVEQFLNSTNKPSDE